MPLLESDSLLETTDRMMFEEVVQSCTMFLAVSGGAVAAAVILFRWSIFVQSPAGVKYSSTPSRVSGVLSMFLRLFRAAKAFSFCSSAQLLGSVAPLSTISSYEFSMTSRSRLS